MDWSQALPFVIGASVAIGGGSIAAIINNFPLTIEPQPI